MRPDFPHSGEPLAPSPEPIRCPPVRVAKSLHPAELEAFSLLPITPGNWGVLFAMPFLKVADRLSARSRRWFHLWRCPWPGSEQDWTAFLKRLDQWVRDRSQFPHSRDTDIST
jgi:hypothetical protein